jgi:uncharacterized membrane protein YedE/YeeE
MKQNLLSAVVGFLFALGLGISGMTDPQKIISFLDIFGKWNPSLLFVMLGAISVHLVAYRFIIKRSTPLYSDKWHVPKSKKITRSVVTGSLLFGIGWGLAGYCPGPALASVATLSLSPLVFVVCMIAGMGFFKIVNSKVHFTS